MRRHLGLVGRVRKRPGKLPVDRAYASRAIRLGFAEGESHLELRAMTWSYANDLADGTESSSVPSADCTAFADSVYDMSGEETLNRPGIGRCPPM